MTNWEISVQAMNLFKEQRIKKCLVSSFQLVQPKLRGWERLLNKLNGGCDLKNIYSPNILYDTLSVQKIFV